jgi:hypothetical protein
MGEHDNLQAIVGHVLGHGTVGLDHGFAEALVLSLDR